MGKKITIRFLADPDEPNPYTPRSAEDEAATPPWHTPTPADPS